ncbi:MAG: cation diffusion facilitator family transporter [Anaerolineales bacterium]|nr:cation diffusion facilitator family transporter [Anaerolineales bacterium]
MAQTKASEQEGRSSYYGAVARVLLQVFAANLFVALVKIGLGLGTGALAVVADGFHSLVDSSSNLIGLASVRLADRPADEKHPYGYWRYETIGALAIGVMLLVAAIELGRAILDRIFGGAEAPEGSLVLILVFALTIPINLGIVVFESRAGTRLQSEILLADAAHTRSDLFVTFAVLVSLIGGLLGYPGLDLIVTGVVLVLILRAALRILLDTSRWLTDAGFADIAEVEEIAQSVSGVQYVHRVRSRGTPDAGFVDLHVKVYPGMSTSQAHAIASEVENQLIQQIPNLVDALVHIEPARIETAGNWEQIRYDLRKIADGMGLGMHDLRVNLMEDRRYLIEVHLEMAGDLSIGEAHALAEEFESRVEEEWPQTGQVVTHLEPLPETVQGGAALEESELAGEVRRAILELLDEGDLQEVQISRIGGGRNAAVIVSFPDGYSLVEAHQIAEKIERELLLGFPDLHRVIVHVEPESTIQ